MKRIATGLAFAACCSAAGLAQIEVKPITTPPPGMGAPQRPEQPKVKPPLKGLDRIFYLMRQLDLKPEQKTGVEGLIETHFNEGQPSQTAAIDLEQIRGIWKEMEDAQKAGDKEKQERLTKQLQDIGKKAQEKSEKLEGEEEFFSNLDKLLTPEQKALFKGATERLNNNPSGALRPVDVIRAAEQLKLNDKQKSDLETAANKFRGEINSRDASTPAEERRGKLLDGLIEQVRGTLSPDQQPVFDRRILAMRPEAGQGLNIIVPAGAKTGG